MSPCVIFINISNTIWNYYKVKIITIFENRQNHRNITNNLKIFTSYFMEKFERSTETQKLLDIYLESILNFHHKADNYSYCL